MTLKFFLVFISSFFASSVIIMVLLKKINANFSNLGGKTWWTNILYSIGGALVSFLSTLFTTNYLNTYMILSAVATLLGMLLVFITHKRFFKQHAHNRSQQSVTEILYTVSVLNFIIIGLVASLYYFTSDKFLFFPMLCSMLFFLVPLLLYHAYLNLIYIPAPVYEYWEYPLLNPITLDDDDDNSPLLEVGFKLKKKESEKESVFRTKAPQDMILGDLLYHFINEYNEVQSETPIQFVDENHQPEKWYFRTAGKGLRSSRVLNPHQTIKQNKLREDDIIICDRIYTN